MRRGFIDQIRKRPRQPRAQATVDAILDAAAELLSRGEVVLQNTNRIAERAGVSIGTLYQYFGDREAILAALIERDNIAMRAETADAAENVAARTLEEYVREMVRRYVQARQRRGPLGSLLSRAMGGAGLEGQLFAVIESVRREAILGRLVALGVPTAAAEQASFVAVHAVVGAVRAAERADATRLKDPAFLAALVSVALAPLRRAEAAASQVHQGS